MEGVWSKTKLAYFAIGSAIDELNIDKVDLYSSSRKTLQGLLIDKRILTLSLYKPLMVFYSIKNLTKSAVF